MIYSGLENVSVHSRLQVSKLATLGSNIPIERIGTSSAEDGGAGGAAESASKRLFIDQYVEYYYAMAINIWSAVLVYAHTVLSIHSMLVSIDILQGIIPRYNGLTDIDPGTCDSLITASIPSPTSSRKERSAERRVWKHSVCLKYSVQTAG